MSALDNIRAAAAHDEALAGLGTADVLDAQTFPPTKWAVPGIVPEGLGILIAPPKAGKSWATEDLALAVASGTNAFGSIPTGDPRPVLLMAMEDSPKRLQSRFRKLRPGVPFPELLHYPKEPVNPIDVPGIVGTWLGYYGAFSPLVIIDTFGKIQTPPAGHEGPYSRDYRIVGGIKAMADRHLGTAILLVHHTNTNGETEDWMDGTSGTNGINGAADYTIFLNRKRGADTARLLGTGRDMPDYEYALDFNDGLWTLAGHDLAEAAHRAEELRARRELSPDRAAVLDLVNATSDGVRAADVVAALSITDDAARQALKALSDRGYIDRAERGLYVRVTGDVTNVTSSRSHDEERDVVTDVTPPVTDGGESR